MPPATYLKQTTFSRSPEWKMVGVQASLISLRVSLWSLLAFFVLISSLASATDNCQTLSTEISVYDEKTYEYNGRRIRLTCAGMVMVNKCEGACTSEVSPSVVHFPGFKKDCKCCRETEMIELPVTLDRCYNVHGEVIGQTMTIFIRQPSQCRCYDCSM